MKLYCRRNRGNRVAFCVIAKAMKEGRKEGRKEEMATQNAFRVCGLHSEPCSG